MKIVSAKCPQCGAPIQVDGDRDAGICKYCGNAFVTEKAINNFQVTNNISNSIVHIDSGSKEKLEKLIKGAEALERNGKNALEEWDEIIRLYPEDHRGWMQRLKYLRDYNEISKTYVKALALSETEEDQGKVKKVLYNSLLRHLEYNCRTIYLCLKNYFTDDLVNVHEEAKEYVESYVNNGELHRLKTVLLSLSGSGDSSYSVDSIMICDKNDFSLMPFIWRGNLYWEINNSQHSKDVGGSVCRSALSRIEAYIDQSREIEQNKKEREQELKSRKESAIRSVNKYCIGAAIVLVIALSIIVMIYFL